MGFEWSFGTFVPPKLRSSAPGMWISGLHANDPTRMLATKQASFGHRLRPILFPRVASAAIAAQFKRRYRKLETRVPIARYAENRMALRSPRIGFAVCSQSIARSERRGRASAAPAVDGVVSLQRRIQYSVFPSYFRFRSHRKPDQGHDADRCSTLKARRAVLEGYCVST